VLNYLISIEEEKKYIIYNGLRSFWLVSAHLFVINFINVDRFPESSLCITDFCLRSIEAAPFRSLCNASCNINMCSSLFGALGIFQVVVSLFNTWRLSVM